MLGSIRKKIKGWLAYTIIGLITVPFALFGIAEYATSRPNVAVALVDDEEISQEKFLSRFNQQKRHFQQELGEKYTPEFDTRLKRLVIQEIVNQYLLNRLAKELGYVTTAGELQASIQANNDFKVDGQFSLDRYQQLLRLNGYSDVQYEGVKSTELIQRQIKQNLLDSAFIGASALQQLQSLNDQQREFRYMRLNTQDYTDKVSVDSKRVRDFFDENRASFFEPEQVKLDFIELSLAEVIQTITVNDDELLNFYQEEKQRFVSEEERQAQHILLADKADAKKVLDLLTQNGDFAALAKQYSEDTGSKDNAGDLGFFTRGVMVPAFETQAFSMQEGELSGLVKSEFGYHIIKLNKIKPTVVKPFTEVKPELLALYKQTQAKKELYGLAEQLANLAYESNLEEAARQLGLKLKTSEFFDRNNTELDIKMVRAAFSDVVLNKGENSEVLELSKDKFIVVRLKQKIPQREKAFVEVQAEIHADLITLAAKTWVDNTVKKIATLLQKGDDKGAKKIMQQHKIVWQHIGWVTRDTEKAQPEMIEKVFALPKPSAGKSTYNAESVNQNYAVLLELSGVKETTDKVVNHALERSLLQLESNEIFEAILTTLRENADLKIFVDRL